MGSSRPPPATHQRTTRPTSLGYARRRRSFLDAHFTFIGGASINHYCFFPSFHFIIIIINSSFLQLPPALQFFFFEFSSFQLFEHPSEQQRKNHDTSIVCNCY